MTAKSKNRAPEAEEGLSFAPLDLLIVLGLLLIVFACYRQALQFDFVNFDDQFYVSENPAVKSGLTLAGLRWAITDAHLGTWHPLTWLSHMLDVEFFGTAPGLHHLTNVLLHMANTSFLFALLRAGTGSRWRSALVAALFGLHPLHVESVAWIAERKDVLSTFFGFSSLWAYILYARQGRQSRKHYWFAFGFLVLGLLSKPMLVTWPLLFLILDFWPLGRWAPDALRSKLPAFGGLIREKVPFLVISLIVGCVTLLTQHQAGAAKALANYPLDLRLGNAVASGWRYVEKMFLPVDLAVFYPLSNEPGATAIVGASLLLLAITGVAIYVRKRAPFVAVGWFWYLLTISPVIGVIQVGSQAMADRYTYIPAVGIFLLASWGLALAASTKAGRLSSSVIGVAVVAVSFALASRQLACWKDSESLFRHAVQVTQRNALAYHCLASALYQKGQVEKSLAAFATALEIQPDYFDAHVAYGVALREAGRPREAIEQLDLALRQNSTNAAVRLHLGLALDHLGDLAGATLNYRAALELDPGLTRALCALGFALQRAGDVPEAISRYRAALKLDPTLGEVWMNLGAAQAQQGDLEEAIGSYRAAIRAKPDMAAAYFNLGNLLANQRRLDEAVTNLQMAVKLKPDYEKARTNLANLLVLRQQVGGKDQAPKK